MKILSIFLLAIMVVSRKRFNKILFPFLLVVFCFVFANQQIAQALGIYPITLTGFPDLEQFPSYYWPSPPPHADLWWTNLYTKDATMMCGPTSATNSALWLSQQSYPSWTHVERLAQVWDGSQWVAPVNPAVLIEEFAKYIGSHQGPVWSWDLGEPFPGTLGPSDADFLAGKMDYFRVRQVPVKITRITTSDIMYDTLIYELLEGEDIELSTTSH
jgi:hypothetical protein